MTVGTLTMAARGRPKSSEDKQTATIRVRKDLASMLAWIGRVLDKDSAEILDPVIRDAITSQYVSFYPAISAIKHGEDAAAELLGKEPGDPLPPLPTFETAEAPDPTSAKPKRKKL